MESASCLDVGVQYHFSLIILIWHSRSRTVDTTRREVGHGTCPGNETFVEDYAKWKTAFDDARETRRAAGCVWEGLNKQQTSPRHVEFDKLMLV